MEFKKWEIVAMVFTAVGFWALVAASIFGSKTMVEVFGVIYVIGLVPSFASLMKHSQHNGAA